MAGGNYRIKIVRADQQLEIEGDKTFVLDMLKRYGGTEASDLAATPRKGKSPGKTAPADAPTGVGKRLSVGEFVRQTGLKKHTDLVVAFGYYLEKYGDVKEFTSADINNCYYEARLESSNTSQMIIQNIKRRYLMIAKGSAAKEGKGSGKRYTLTTSGEQFIESKLTRTNE